MSDLHGNLRVSLTTAPATPAQRRKVAHTVRTRFADDRQACAEVLGMLGLDDAGRET